jgi:hypothetical protein
MAEHALVAALLAEVDDLWQREGIDLELVLVGNDAPVAWVERANTLDHCGIKPVQPGTDNLRRHLDVVLLENRLDRLADRIIRARHMDVDEPASVDSEVLIVANETREKIDVPTADDRAEVDRRHFRGGLSADGAGRALVRSQRRHGRGGS